MWWRVVIIVIVDNVVIINNTFFHSHCHWNFLHLERKKKPHSSYIGKGLAGVGWPYFHALLICQPCSMMGLVPRLVLGMRLLTHQNPLMHNRCVWGHSLLFHVSYGSGLWVVWEDPRSPYGRGAGHVGPCSWTHRHVSRKLKEKFPSLQFSYSKCWKLGDERLGILMDK